MGQSLFLQITTGRGHLWINDKDLGRFWNITEGRTDKYSQQYYFLPIDYLRTDGSMNEVVLFSTMGGGSLIQNNTKLVLFCISDPPPIVLKSTTSFIEPSVLK